MAEKVSVILLTARLVSSSIPHQGQNITILFASKGFMTPINIKHHQIINTHKMRLIMSKSHDAYTVLHHDRARKIVDKIPMTT